MSQTINRHPERARTDRDDLDAILDAALVATLSTVVDGRPWVVPMLFARDGDRILVHGSTGAGTLRLVAAGAPVALCVTHIDGLVVAHTTFESSANYRSAVVSGQLQRLTAEDRSEALTKLSGRLIPGRPDEVRPMTRKELSATLAMQLQIVDGQWTVKVRQGWSVVPDEATDAWIGVVPIATVVGQPRTAPHSPTQELPASVRRLVADGVSAR